MAMDGSQKPVRSMQIFANLLHAFSSNSKSSDSSVCVQNPTPLLEAREGLLSVLPRVIGTLLSIWGAWNLDNPNDSLPSSMALLGTAKVRGRFDSNRFGQSYSFEIAPLSMLDVGLCRNMGPTRQVSIFFFLNIN